MSEWTYAKLGEMLKVHHGFAFSGERMTDDLTGGPIVVSIGNFNYTGGFRFESTRVREFRGEYPGEFELAPGDLLVVMTCQTPGGEILGIPGIIPDDGKVYLHNQRIGRVEVIGDRLRKSFAYYLFLTSEVNRQLFSTASGTKILHTSPGRIEDVRCHIPPPREQDGIAAVLGALDDKIAVNGRIAAAADELAGMQFRGHFSAALNHLIHGAPLPPRWAAVAMGERTITVETGTRPKGGVAQYLSGVPSIGAESIIGLGKFDFAKTKFIPDEFFSGMRRGVVEDRDILVYKDGGKPGDFRPHVTLFGNGFPFSKMCINEHVYRVRMTADIGQDFGYYWLTSAPIMAEMRRRGTGAAIPGMNSSAFKGIPLVVPPSERISSFTAAAAPLVDRALLAAVESRSLTALRDTLLPQLMSGSLRIKDAEKIVEDHV
ncbi:restriction endonuclease subunit S [Streptomyces niveiscabiei]|uniref:restriction endonuclease subunit S n=1 Tax=Streptomyces niveiscabiei TaxID=164115 RepID=UPI0029A8CDA8|nr:restriction endonuclease subunit S [Streptomyces niveiscabiei]MDX3385546.1 restriction endonuclease subunit S [Streptomyces niveiscabiei]